jgi:predicted anti-sigma-YlaC factor YlaD
MIRHIHNKTDRIVKLVHDYLGKNSQTEILDEVANHMKNCPECFIYVDSVKQTIQLMKKIEINKKLPSAIENRLYKSLNIRR